MTRVSKSEDSSIHYTLAGGFSAMTFFWPSSMMTFFSSTTAGSSSLGVSESFSSVVSRADRKSQVRQCLSFCSDDSMVGQRGPKISCTKTNTLPKLRLPSSSASHLRPSLGHAGPDGEGHQEAVARGDEQDRQLQWKGRFLRVLTVNVSIRGVMIQLFT